MRWIRRRPGSTSTEASVSLGGGGKRGGIPRALEVAAAVAGIVGLGFVAAPVVEGLIEGSGSARLEVGEIAVANRPASYESGTGYRHQTRATSPRIEATVRNRGDETAWIDEARIVIEDSARLSTCLFGGAGGDVARTAPYRITLPDYPEVGRRVIHRGLHIEVQPGRGVRPVLVFQIPDALVSHLYAIRVELISTQNDVALGLGRFVLGVPEPVQRGGGMLPESDSVLAGDATYGANVDKLTSTWCFRSNLAAVRRVISSPGRRSPQVAALDHLQVASSWPSYVDRSPLPRAIEGLLRSSNGRQGPMYAVFAAERSSDPALVRDVSGRAAALMERRAREVLDEGYATSAAVADAERAILLQSTAARRKLLWRAKASLQAEEEQRAREEVAG